MKSLLSDPTRVLFFTGKGGVGKTSIACATAIALADRGARVLLVSTDPASNLDEVLGTPLGSEPVDVNGVSELSALNIDPAEAARAYRERVVGPYRGVLPDAAVSSIEEQLSGACTVEIASFDEFTLLLGDPSATREYDHVIFDTAPTGHTLRLLELPAAWSGFIETNVGGTSCLGPLAGLKAQHDLYTASCEALRSKDTSTLILVARPDAPSLREAERTRRELAELGIHNLRLVVNGLFRATNGSDPTAAALEERGLRALADIPKGLQSLRRSEVPLLPFALLGVDALRTMSGADVASLDESSDEATSFDAQSLEKLADELAASGRGVVMTMGKGGVGKTTVAAALATSLASRGLPVTLTTTDPAAHVEQATTSRPPSLKVERIDPAEETRRYTEETLATAGATLDEQGRALLAEELRSPCTEEIAVFRAFAETVAQGEDRFVVVDTAPTGHTLLLLDSTEAYHREVLKQTSAAPEAVRQLLPRLRDPIFTRILLVTLPEATPIHEAQQLERDLLRADITPYAWVVNQSLTPLEISDPILRSRRSREAPLLAELAAHAHRLVLRGWTARETDRRAEEATMSNGGAASSELSDNERKTQ